MSLLSLGKKFGTTPLYMVGGAVRNTLLHLPPKDIDITASMRAEDVISLLDGTEFKVVPSSLRMGTLIIKDGKDSYEYTSFRVDSYPLNSGVHRPLEVLFTDDINMDARRRDFTVNAIYQNVVTGEIVDPLGGVDDIKRRVLRTTRSPLEVFSEDGLRLMRLVRFYAELGFEIDGECFEVAKSLCHLLKDISVERIEEEFSKILIADTRGYGNVNGHYKGICKLIEMGGMQYVVPELLEGKGMMQNPKFHDDDVLTHVLNAFKISHPSIRLAALLHDIGKPYEMRKVGNMHMHNVSGATIARDIMTRLRYPNKVIDEVSRLVYIHMFDINMTAKENTIKKFIVENHDIMDKFLLLRFADVSSSLGGLGAYDRIKRIYDEMIREDVPMTLDRLKVNGGDIVALGYKGEVVGKILTKLLISVATSTLVNDKDVLLRYVRGESWK